MGFVMFIHVVVCILLVITILMQAGRGGGLAESFTAAESMFGTQTNTFMVRLSTILATMFICTSLILAVNSSKKDRSLMANTKMLPKTTAPKAAAKVEENTVTVKVEDPKPMAASAAGEIERKVATVKPVVEKQSEPITNSIK